MGSLIWLRADWSFPHCGAVSTWMARVVEGTRCLRIKGRTNESAERRVLPGSGLLLAMIVEVITNT